MPDFNIQTLSKRSAHSVIALISRTFLLNVISLGTSLVVFSILTPRDVGIYTAVVAIQRIVSFFSDFGFGAALVQKKDALNEKEITTIFTLQSLLTFSLFLLIFVFIQPLSEFFRFEPAGSRLLLVLVFSIFLSSFKAIPSILLERKIEFQKLVIPQISESIIFNVLLIYFVLTGWKIDSFVFAFLASSLVSIPFYYWVSPWRIKFGIYRESFLHLKFGFQFQAKNILATLKDDLLTVFLSKILSFTEIGYIGFAQRLAFFIFRYIVDSVTKVTFSTYSRIQDDTQTLRKGLEKSLFYVSAIMFPVLSGLVITIPYIITFFPKWHNKWEPAIISFIFFSLNALVSSLSGILVNILDSTGHVKITLKLMILWTLLTWIMTPVFLLFFGFHGVSIASFLVTLTIFITISQVKKVVQFEFLKSIFKPFVCSVTMCIVLYSATRMFSVNFITLIVLSCLSGVLYIVLLLLLAGNDLKIDVKKVFK